MGSTQATAGASGLRTPGLRVAVIQAVAVTVWVIAVFLTRRWDHWDSGELALVAAFAVASDLASVGSGLSKIKFSGLPLGTVLAAVLFGGAPAGLIGLLAGAVGWFRWREAPHYLRNNLVTFAWFPLAAGLFFGAVTRLAHVGPNDAAYYFLVLPAFMVANVVNHIGVFAYQCHLDDTSLVAKLRDGLIPILSAELFAAVLTAFAVYFVVKTGTIGVGVLLVTLAIFQYLVGELLTSKRRGE
jgi:hypothetical protein